MAPGRETGVGFAVGGTIPVAVSIEAHLFDELGGDLGGVFALGVEPLSSQQHQSEVSQRGFPRI